MVSEKDIINEILKVITVDNIDSALQLYSTLLIILLDMKKTFNKEEEEEKEDLSDAESLIDYRI
jgi:hypothetical protein